ncbi:MAG TPA: secretin N-terminal domain-containing protein, partial [Fimbriimonas sp.]|nr:secretin N-terminal domain-containing protein [Fimbriimonas sp.]
MRKINLSALALTFGLVIPGLALAQDNPFFGGGVSTQGGGGGGSIDSMKFKSNAKIKLDFRNANIDMVLSMFQKTSGYSIVKDPSLTGSITLTSAAAVPLKTAFNILKKTLELKSYDLRVEGDLVVIAKRNERGGGGGPFGQSNGQMPQIDWGALMGNQQQQSVLKIYPIKFANATQVSRVVNEVFLSAGQSQNPFQAMFGGGNAMRFGGGGQRGGNRGGGFSFGSPFGGFGGGGQQGTTVRASADDYSNSVIVNAPEKEQKEVERVIRTIDKETDQPQVTSVYKLKYATATEIAATVQNVLTNNAPRGRGGVTSSGTNFQDRFQQAARFGSTQAAFGTVAADARTNSLVVTATDESQLIVTKVIKDLDTEIAYENTTFVIPLNNAKADDVANLINQSFGQRQGTNRGRTGQNTGSGARANNGGRTQNGGGGGGNA